jgi:hypothetical protein
MVAGAMAIGAAGGSSAATMEPDGDCPASERAAIARPSAAAGLVFPIERSGLMIPRAVMFWQPVFFGSPFFGARPRKKDASAHFPKFVLCLSTYLSRTSESHGHEKAYDSSAAF